LLPDKTGEEVLGIIECFSRQVRVPDDNFLQMLAGIGRQLGQFLERKHADEARLGWQLWWNLPPMRS